MISDIIKVSIIFNIIDSVYLYSMSGKFKNMIKNIQGSNLKMNLVATLLCYIFLIFSLYYFIISKRETILSAFLLGLCIYGVYETTNLAIFQDWNPIIGIVDTIWGGILFSLTYFIYLSI